jgi:transposase-like protein
MEDSKFPTSLLQASRYFDNPDVCVEFVASMRWPDGPICPNCGSREHSFLTTRRIWKCKAKTCRKQFSVKTGTIFEDSPIPLDKWLMAIWLVVNCKNGISSYEIARDLKLTQKSAWFVLHRVRLALRNGSLEKMGTDGSPVEIDEAFVGGDPRKMHASRRRKLKGKFGIYGNNKTIVMGMLDRETRQVRAKLIPDVTRETLMNEILNHVERGATVYTDEHTGYSNMHQFVHETVTHAEEYVRGQVHTQGIENFWSLLKRSLRGTYVAVEPFHLSKYLDEQMFRFNNRATKENPLDDADRFMLAVSQISGKRLTYADLTGKVEGVEPF